MMNICCGSNEERHKHGALAVNASIRMFDFDDEYDAKATERENQITRHQGMTRLQREHVTSICTMDCRAGFSFVSPSFPKPSETTELLLKAMHDNFVFDSMNEKMKLDFAGAMQPKEYKEGEWIMRQGDVGDYFYIVEEGEIAIHIEGGRKLASAKKDLNYLPPQVGTGSKGSSFGELALLYNTRRAASIRAVTPLKSYRIDQVTFRCLLMATQLEDRSNLISLVKKSSVFQDLNDDQVCKLVDAFTIVKFGPGERIINKGDRGNVLYIVKSGEVKEDDFGHGHSKYQDRIIKEGECFGVQALISGRTRVANVTAVTSSSLLAITKDVIEEIIGPLIETARHSHLSTWLSSIPLFESLERAEIDHCVKYLKEERFKKGDKLLTTMGKLYLIEEGHVLMTIHEADVNKNVDGSDKKEMAAGLTLVKFGEQDYFLDSWGSYKEGNMVSPITTTANNGTNENTINVEADLKCLSLVMSDIQSLISRANCKPRTVELQKNIPRFQSRGTLFKDMQRKSKRLVFIKKKKTSMERDAMNLSKLDKHYILGTGAYGKVWLVTPKTTTKDKPTPYALKMISKRQLLEQSKLLKQNFALTVLREKNVMESIEHPFLVRMVSSFQDENYLYLVMGLVLGGTLLDVIDADDNNSSAAWKESEFYKSYGAGEKPIKGLAGLCVRKAAFYSACVIEAFAYLHSRRIVYRDLKTENVMVNEKGYCTIVDMGFAKVVMDKTYTMCGTLEYLAPEMIVSKGHNHVADYWSFACLLYELIVGHTPFFEEGIDQLSLLKKICKADYTFPSQIDQVSSESSCGLEKALSNWKDLVSQLLKPGHVERLGNLRNGIDDIFDHDWFAHIRFDELRDLRIPAPWIPTVVDPLDTSPFVRWFHLFLEQKKFPDTLSADDQKVFEGF